MDERLPDDLAIAVVNETRSRTTANVGCRAGGDVLFVDRVTLAPGERREWSEPAAGTVEVAVQVKDGPEAAERFDPGDGTGAVSATIAASSISFSTDGGREATGGTGNGGIDSFAAAETSDDDGAWADSTDGDDSWGFGGGSTDNDDAWGFDDDPGGSDPAGGADGVGTGSSTSTGSASGADSGWGFDDAGDEVGDAGDAGDDRRSSSGTAGTAGSPEETRRSGGDRSAARGSTGSTGDDRSSTGSGSVDREPAGREGSGRDRRRSGDDHDGTGSGAARDGADVDSDPDPAEKVERGGPRDADDGAGESEASVASDPDRSEFEAGVTDEPEAEGTDGDEERTAGAGEKYCRSCGAVIKQEAAICPECGVSNEGSVGGAGGGRGAGPASEPSDWGTGVLVGGALWGINLVLVLLIVVSFRSSMGGGLDAGGALRSLGLATVLPLTQFLAWVVFTVAIYYDMKYVRHHVPDWPLNGTLYIAAAIVLPVFTQVFGAAALFVGGTVGLAVAAVVPAVLLGLAVRHTRTRNRLVTSA